MESICPLFLFGFRCVIHNPGQVILLELCSKLLSGVITLISLLRESPQYHIACLVVVYRLRSGGVMLHSEIYFQSGFFAVLSICPRKDMVFLNASVLSVVSR